MHIIHRVWPFEDTTYPPTANEWATGSVIIPGWTYLGSNVYPEPGFITGKASASGPGHCGIVDYDGWVISARSHGVSRKAMKMFSSKCAYNKPKELVDE